MMKIDKDQVADVLPLSPQQEGIFFHYLNNPDFNIYSQQVSITLNGEIEETPFTLAWHKVAQDNEMLRTVFAWEGLKKPFQVVLKNARVPVRYCRVDAVGPAADAEVEKLRRADREALFNLEEAAFRVTLIGQPGARHTLLLNFHHVIFDGWSNSIVLREFFRNYAAFARHAPLTGKRAGVYKQYLSFLSNPHPAGEADFWAAYLATYETPVALPYFKPATPPANRVANVTKPLPEAWKARLVQTAKTHRVSEASVYYAAWALLLHKTTGKKAVTFGTATAGRPNAVAGIEEAVGLFINTLPVHLRIDGQETAGTLLQRVHGLMIGLQAHGGPALPEVKRMAGIRQEGELFNTLCVIENYPLDVAGVLAGSGLVLENFDVTESSNYDLMLSVQPFRLDQTFCFSFDSARLDAAGAGQLAGFYLNLLGQLVGDPARRVDNLEIIDEPEKQQILRTFNDTGCPFPATPMHALLEEQARKTPGNTALIWDGGRLSYAELDAAASRLASVLARSGVGEKVVVCVCMERCPELIISLFAIGKAGGVYLPVDPAFSRLRMDYLLEDSAAALVLVGENAPATLDGKYRRLTVKAADLLEATGEARFPAVCNPELPAYIIYTSGSTGQPKGVLVPHYALANRIHWMQKKYPISDRDVLVQKTPVVFDVSVWELFWWASRGAALYLLPPGVEKEADRLVACTRDNKVSVIHFVPSMLGSFLKYAEMFEKRSDLQSLRLVFASGEALKTQHAADFRAFFGVGRSPVLANLYGPTEATIDVTFFDCDASEPAETIPIGKPIDNAQLYVLNEALQLQPVGVTGELHIGGAPVADGYLNKPGLTAARFIDNPYGDGRLYKTGDLARWQEDGNLVFLGRSDHQVKIRGYRIEPGEIENRLVLHPAVEDAVVLVKEDGHQDKFLCAFCAGAATPDGAELSAFLLQTLPAYMVPKVFVGLPAFPLTHNGKVDRAAMAAMPLSGAGQAAASADGTNETEEKLLRCCQEILGGKPLSREDNFFRAGGDSIKAIRLLSFLRRDGLNLRMKDLFDYPVLKELAARVESHTRTRHEQPEGPVPLVPIQQYFFATDRQRVDHFNQAVLFRLRKPCTVAALNAVFAVLLERHDAFRLRFDAGGAQVQQYLDRHAPALRIEEADVSGAPRPEAALENEINALHAAVRVHASPLVQARLINARDGQYFAVVMHHLVVDGVSWRILIEELGTLLGQYFAGQPLSLPPASSSFGEYAARLADPETRKMVAKEMPYWQAQAARPVQAIPPGGPAETAGTHASLKRVIKVLPDGCGPAVLGEIENGTGANANEILLAAACLALHRVFDVRNFFVDVEGHGRHELGRDLDLSQTVGWFTALFPVYISVETQEGVLGYLRTVKEAVRRVPNDGVGYGINKYLYARAGESSVAFPDIRPGVRFNYLGDLSGVGSNSFFEAQLDTIGWWIDPARRLSHGLDFIALREAGRLSMFIDYDENQFRPQTIAALHGEMEAALAAFGRACRGLSRPLKSPSDFTYRDFDAAACDRMLAQHEVDDVYELSPTQQGLLAHALFSDDGNAYRVASGVGLEGDLHPELLAEAYRRLLGRHDVLRTFFDQELLHHPLQFVRTTSGKQLLYNDISHLEPQEAAGWLGAYLDQQRHALGEVLSAEPLVNLALVKTGARTCKLFWFYHHILLDGWSVILLTRELLLLYEALGGVTAAAQPPSPPYKSYIGWLREQDRDQAGHFWKQYLKGFSQPFAFHQVHGNGPEQQDRSHRLVIAARDYQALRDTAAEAQVTLYNVIGGIWALLLSKWSAASDVLFGQVVSGRPAIPHVDHMVGLFINTIPKRVTLDGKVPFVEFIRAIAADDRRTVPYHYFPLADIQRQSLPGDRLISNILVFESQYQLMAPAQTPGALAVKEVEGHDPNHYHLSVFVFDSADSLTVEFRYNQATIDLLTLGMIAGDFGAIAAEVARQPLLVLDEIITRTLDEEILLPALGIQS